MKIDKLVLCVAFGLIATVAFAANSFSIDDLVGVYKHRFENGDVDGNKYQSEDVLEIVKTAHDKAYVRVYLEFYNGHTCDLAGIAKVEGNELVYRGEKLNEKCVLKIRRSANQIAFDDKDRGCEITSCGARGHYDIKTFEYQGRRPIRYMKRLLASREYAEAVAEQNAQK